MSRQAFLVASLAFSAGCASSPGSLDWIEAEVRSSVVSESGEETVLFEGRSSVLLAPSSTRVVSQGEALILPEAQSSDDSADPERRKTGSSTLWDYESGWVWVTRDGGPRERSLFAEVLYEERNRLRQDRMELLAQFLHSAWLRGRDDQEVCWGDLRVLDGNPIQANGQESRVRYIAVEPGEYWEVALAPEGSPLERVASREACLAGVLGLSTDRAQRILQKLGGMPWRVISVRVAPQERREYFRVTRLVEAREATADERSSRECFPTPAELEAANAADAPMSVASTLQVLLSVSKGEQELPPFTTVVGLCLKLAKKLRPEDIDQAVKVCGEAGDSLVQVELARLALRSSFDRAWRGLRPLVIGSLGLTAMNVAEALAAEGSSKALPAAIHILRRRQEYTDVDRKEVTEWALRHIRALSDVEPGEVLGAMGNDSLEEAEQQDLSKDLDFWLRWSEAQKGRLPEL